MLFIPRILSLCAATILAASSAIAGGKPTPTSSTSKPGILLVDPAQEPHVKVRWTNAHGEAIEFSEPRPYTTDPNRTPIGGNLDCYVSVGGVRLSKGAGHPRGSVVRVGFYKQDKNRPMFDNITKDTVFEVRLTGVHFNQPVDAHTGSIVQHIKYDRGDMESCGIPGDAREQFNTASPTDTLNDRIRPGIDTRQGTLDGSDDSLGSSNLKIEDDGSVTMTVRFRYPALRNLRDPWQSDLPGTFLEPIHFHIEFEALPEGVEPLDPTREREQKLQPAD